MNFQCIEINKIFFLKQKNTKKAFICFHDKNCTEKEILISTDEVSHNLVLGSDSFQLLVLESLKRKVLLRVHLWVGKGINEWTMYSENCSHLFLYSNIHVLLEVKKHDTGIWYFSQAFYSHLLKNTMTLGTQECILRKISMSKT